MIQKNKIYYMDNLELLHKLPKECIDLIYCDILYGTGKNYGEFEDINADRQEVEGFYLLRLKEMYRVLKDTGSIYLQMDWRINHWVRIMMDEVFGYKNFRNEVIWSYHSCGTGKTWIRQHDTIFFYTKSAEFIFNKLFERVDYEKAFMDTQEDEDGFYRIVRIRDVWEDIKYLMNFRKERVGYPAQKPKALLERIIKASSNEGDLIADFFCGSGTTCVVAKELNRNYIGCDNSPEAVLVSRKRIRKEE